MPSRLSKSVLFVKLETTTRGHSACRLPGLRYAATIPDSSQGMARSILPSPSASARWLPSAPFRELSTVKRTQPVVGVGECVTVGCNDGAGDGNGVGCGVGAMTGDAVGLPGVAVGAGVGRGVGSGAGADDEGADDGIEDGDGWLLRFFLSEASATPKTY